MFLARFLVIFLFIASVFFFGLFLQLSLFVSDFLDAFNRQNENETFDYIVVGAGSAGSVIAKRLAQDGKTSVLVLEAGRELIDLLHIPSAGLLLQNSQYDWSYRTVPQKNACLALDNQSSKWPMGKVLGGTGVLNNMIYVRGHKSDFDDWFQFKEGYSYDEVLHYFKKLEGSDDGDLKKPVQLSKVPFFTQLPEIIFKAASMLGYSILPPNPDTNLGFYMPLATLYNGQRWTPARALKVNKSQNLHIITNSMVTKILLKFNFEAQGVEYLHRNKNFNRAFASKAVILSAGVVGTPKLLMLSGIGPKDHLQHLNISPVIDLPVGDNLHDHVTTGMDLVFLNDTLSLELESILSPFSLFHYFTKGAGPWTTIGCEAVAFFNTSASSKPDLQFMIMPLGINEDSGYYLRKLIGITDDTWKNYFLKISQKSITILPVLLHPKSSGTVRLLSSNPLDPPLIDPKYLTNREDVDVLIKGIKIIKQLTETEEFKKAGGWFNDIVLPACQQYEFDTREYWECYIRHFTITSYHPVGTCKMGKDPSSVVNFNFQLKGLNKLYVVDGSVLPSQVSGNVNAAILMLAEMAADYVKMENYLNKEKCDIVELFIPKNRC